MAMMIPLLSILMILLSFTEGAATIPLYYWDEHKKINFGDHLSLQIVERIVNGPVPVCPKASIKKTKQKFLAIGSILYFARDGDVLWGTGTNGKWLKKENYSFSHLDVRAVRGPLTREFLAVVLGIESPEIYGDPALLFPHLFPEFKKAETPEHTFLVIPHFSEEKLFPKEECPFPLVYPTEPWDVVVKAILNSAFVLSSSLHGLIIAEAFGIPARYLRISENEPLIKYRDYYLSTGRPDFSYATSIEEGLLMGGEPPFACDLERLYNAFPFDLWENSSFLNPFYRPSTCKEIR